MGIMLQKICYNRLETTVVPLTIISGEDLIPAGMGAVQQRLCEQFFMLQDTLPIHDVDYRHLANERISKHTQVAIKISESQAQKFTRVNKPCRDSPKGKTFSFNDQAAAKNSLARE